MNHAPRNPAVHSYYTMRRAVGVTAISLPFVLAIGSVVLSLAGPAHAMPHPLLERSISDYYHTPMRNYLVGSLFAIAAISRLFARLRPARRNHRVRGWRIGSYRCSGSVGESASHHLTIVIMTILAAYTWWLPRSCFLCSPTSACVLFRKTSPHKPLTRRKRHRNRRLFGLRLVMVVCMSVMLSLTVKSVQAELWPTGILFWCESLALFAFGIAWLDQGRSLSSRQAPESQPS